MHEFLNVHIKYLTQYTNRRINVSNLISILHLWIAQDLNFQSNCIIFSWGHCQICLTCDTSNTIGEISITNANYFEHSKIRCFTPNYCSKVLWVHVWCCVMYFCNIIRWGRITNRYIIIRPRDISVIKRV